MSLNYKIIRKIACERDTSQVVPSKPRNELQEQRLTGLYKVLLVLRVVLTLNFQTGWIHQDEFSHSLEVVAGDFFGLQVFKSIAFNSSFPTKSMVMAQTSIGIPYLLGYFHTTFMDDTGKESIPITSRLVLLPRLFNVAISFVIDFLMVQFCKRNNQDHTIRLVTLASSQVLLVFASRTHAASLNLVLYALLLYLVSDSLHRMDAHLPLLAKYHKAKEPVDKVRHLKEMKQSGFSTVGKLHWITFIIVAGVFNDPEFFLAYAAIPLFFYMNRGISDKNVGMLHFHIRCFAFIVYFLLFSIPFILWDSFYYGRVTLEDFQKLSLSPDSFVIAPVNYFADKRGSFIRSTAENAWTWISFLGLFNILGIIGIVSFFKDMYDLTFSPWGSKPKLGSQWTFVNTSLFLPLFFLIPYRSVFDMVPLVFPLVYMHGHKIPLISKFNNKIGLSWFLLNLVGIVYFGYLNRGGILTSLLDLYEQLIPIRFNSTQVDIVFSQVTVIPPIFMLAIPEKWKTLVTAPTAMLEDELGVPSMTYKTVLKMESMSKFRVFHTGLSPLPKSHLERDLNRIIRRNPYESTSPAEKTGNVEKLNYLLIPYSDAKDMEQDFTMIRLHYIKTYWNHLYLSMWSEEGLSRPVIDLGLSLYRIEYLPYWKRSGDPRNFSVLDEKHKLKFHDYFSEAISLLINGFCTVFTIALFIMSYLVFLT